MLIAPTQRTASALRAAALAAIALLPCAPAQAQSVRKCQIDGRVVFQTAPCPIEARVVAAAAPQPAPVAASGAHKKTLAELLHERDGADRARPVAPANQIDGASVLRARMGAI